LFDKIDLHIQRLYNLEDRDPERKAPSNKTSKELSHNMALDGGISLKTRCMINPETCLTELSHTVGTKATGSTNKSTKGQNQGHQKQTAPTAITIRPNKATDNWQHPHPTAPTPPPSDSTKATDNRQHQRTESRPTTTSSTYTTVPTPTYYPDGPGEQTLKIMSNISCKDRQQRQRMTTKYKPSTSKSADNEMPNNINNDIER
jgi:hypothetical protein